MKVIARNADAQASLIEDLLDVSRIISGQMRLDVQALEPAGPSAPSSRACGRRWTRRRSASRRCSTRKTRPSWEIRRVRAHDTEQCRRVPAIALIAYARAEDRRRALAEGFQMHLAKPIDPGELAAAVASLARYAALR